MTCTRKRLRICVVLMVCNILFIWGNSLLPQPVSSAFSKWVGRIISIFFPGEVTPAEGSGQGTLRKVAHFMEFCSLGFLMSWLCNMKLKALGYRLAVPAAGGLLVACIDEGIQYFVPGRGPGLRDVLIDWSGVLWGILVFVVLFLCLQKKRTFPKG